MALDGVGLDVVGAAFRFLAAPCGSPSCCRFRGVTVAMLPRSSRCLSHLCEHAVPFSAPARHDTKCRDRVAILSLYTIFRMLVAMACAPCMHQATKAVRLRAHATGHGLRTCVFGQALIFLAYPTLLVRQFKHSGYLGRRSSTRPGLGQHVLRGRRIQSPELLTSARFLSNPGSMTAMQAAGNDEHHGSSADIAFFGLGRFSRL